MADHESLKRFLGHIAGESFALAAEYKDKSWSITPEDLETAKKQLSALLSSWTDEQDPTSQDEANAASAQE
jgi:hypothetical protein